MDCELFYKVIHLSQEFLNWIYDNISSKDKTAPFLKQDYYNTAFVWDFVDYMEWNQENFLVLLNTKTDDDYVKSKAFRRLFDILCSIQAEYMFCSVTPFSSHLNNVKLKEGDLIYKDILFDVKISTISQNLYDKYISKAIEEHRMLTEEEEYLIANEFYENQLRCCKVKNNYDSNKIHIISACEDIDERLKNKGNRKKVSSAIKRYLNDNIKRKPLKGLFRNPETGEVEEQYYIVIIVY